MRRAIVMLAVMLMVVAPVLVGQTPPAPPQTPKPATPAKPAPRPKVVSPAAVRARALSIQREGTSYLGIEPRDISPQRAQELKLKSSSGVEAVVVDRDSPAGKSGMKEHDVITNFNGNAVEGAEMLRRMIRETPPGRKVTLGVVRDGQPLTLSTELTERTSMFTMPDIHIPPMPPMPEMPEIPAFTVLQFSGRNGVLVEDLTPQLGDYFGAKNGEGVLVRSVEKGSPGEKAGLHAGDVVVRVGEDRIGDMGDWRRATARNRGKTVQLGIIRDKREQTLSLTVPARAQASGGTPESWNIDVEPFEVSPEIAGANRQAMEELRRQMQLHQQDFERSREAGAEVQRYMREHRQEMEELQRELQKMQQELKKDLRISFPEQL